MVQIYSRAVDLLAVLGCLLIAFIFFAVLLDAGLRIFGFPSAPWANPLSEYSMTYVTMFAAPWLVRHKGHIMIESLTEMLAPKIRMAVGVVACAVCIFLCLVITYYAVLLLLESYARGDRDIRSITIPLWWAFLPFPLGFGLSAIEFGALMFAKKGPLAGRSSTVAGI